MVEYWNPFTKRRKDLLNFGDILAIREGDPPLICQTTSWGNDNARLKKIKAEPLAQLWLRAGGEIVVHGWRKEPLKPGSKALRWKPRIREVEIGDFDGHRD